MSYEKLNLYEHNIESYEKIKQAHQGQKKVSIIHATGTGKSYNALQLALDNKDKKIIYIVPSTSILEHIKETLSLNPNIDFERDFPNLIFRTYQSLINMSTKELKELDVDLLIIDEFHHLGAPIWGERINTIVKTHLGIQIFGMTAYTIRDRGTAYERDMVNPETDELFSNTVVSRYDLCDAMVDGILPKPIYRSCYSKLLGKEKILEDKVLKKNATKEEKEQYLEILDAVKKRIFEAPSTYDIIKRDVKNGTKWIYYCPIGTETGKNDIDTIMTEFYNWVKRYIPEEDIVLYKTTSEDGELGKNNREAFYNDVTLEGINAKDKLRVMFAKNQYNEGVHAPNVDGVILGRSTMSDIVFFEQIGRCLSVRGDTKKKYLEYEKYSYEDLLQEANDRNIIISDNLPKEKVIEKLLAPIIIDLANNYEFIKELETKLKYKMKEKSESKSSRKREIKIKDASFDIKVENIDLFQTLIELEEKIAPMTWDDWYELAKSYYEYHQNLQVSYEFKTLNGYDYDESGHNLGRWINTQKMAYKNRIIPKEERKNNLIPLTDDKVMKLESIGIVFTKKIKKRFKWEEMYNLAKNYYNYYGNLNVPTKFKTLNGYVYDEEGVSLSTWLKGVNNQFGTCIIFYSNKEKYKDNFQNLPLTEEQIKKLSIIPLRDIKKISIGRWNKILAEKYRITIENVRYLNQRLPQEIIKNRITYLLANDLPLDQEGKLHEIFFMNESDLNEKYKMNYDGNLLDVGDKRIIEWNRMFELLKVYKDYYRSVSVPIKFKTVNGYEYDENGEELGEWFKIQKDEFDVYLHINHEVKVYGREPNDEKSRKKISLTEKQFEKLWKTNILFEVKKSDMTKLFIKTLMLQCKMKEEDAKLLVERLPKEVINQRILWLLRNNLPLEQDGKLHEIFFMNSSNLKEKYDIDYVVDKTKRKGK